MIMCHGNPLTRSGLFGRRGFLLAGAASGLGLSLPELLMREAAAAPKQYDFLKPRAKSIIHVFLPGGLPQQESFDPKPYSPLEYRGELGTLKTNTGEVFCNTLPKLSQQADKYCVIRSMSHGEAAHERGTHNMFTGYKPSPAIQYPSFGAVISHEYGPRNNLPGYICIPTVPNEHAGTGYLPGSYGAFALGADPARADFQVRDLNLAGGVDAERFIRRKAALERINQRFVSMTSADNVDAMNTFYERAYDLLDTPAAKEAFDLSKEDDKMRDRYGRNTAGARMLMARRLVEAGARMVTLTYGSWDAHANITSSLKNQMPALDQGLSVLLEDLSERGLLEETLVMVTTEFGRTPRINNDAGRDHWPKVFSVMLAGGGIKGGLIHGASDATATEPEADPVSPADLATTMYHLLGIVADKELMSPGARPVEIVDGGKVIQNIIS